jgi:hypothetical protein
LSAHDTAGQGASDRGPDQQATEPERQAAGPGGGAGEPSDDELRAAYEAELSRITATDMMAQAAVSLLNIGAHRLAPPAPAQGPPAPGGAQGEATLPERDLEQARDAIDGVKALLDILDRRIPGELRPLRDALSRLQMAYAREIQPAAGGAPAQSAGASGEQPQPPAGEPQPPAGEPQPPGAQQAPEQGEGPPGPGPAEASGRLWVPGR